MPQVFPENLGLPMRPGTHRDRQTWDCAQPIRALLALLLALHASCCASQPLCVWSLACCSLRPGQSSASPMASGSPSAVSHRVSYNSESEVNFSLCPLLSIHYLATLHALQLLHLSSPPQANPNAAESRSQVRAGAFLRTSSTTCHTRAPGGEGFASFRRGRRTVQGTV